MNSQELYQQYKIIRKGPGCGCGCASGAVRYTLPIKLDDRILPYLQPLGKSCFDWRKTCLIKIENPNFCITGLIRSDTITFTKKNENHPELLDAFENMLIDYVKGI